MGSQDLSPAAPPILMIIRSSKLQEGTVLTEDKDGIILNKTVDIEPVLKANYEAKKDYQNGFSKDHSIRRIASVPIETWVEWTREEPALVLGDRELRENLLRKKLYKEENKVFWTINQGL